MKTPRSAHLPIPIVLLACVALAGCGSGGSSSASTAASRAQPGATGATSTARQAGPNGSSGSGASATEPGPPAGAFVPKHHHDSGGGSEQFEVKGADNSVQEFGAEAGESELKAAAAALHGFLDARAARNWAAACTYLSGEVKRGFTQVAASSQVKGQGCAATLAALSGKVPTSTLAEAAVANVGALRFAGDRAFVIYRGVRGTVFAIAMEKQGGAWKLGSLSGVPLGR